MQPPPELAQLLPVVPAFDWFDHIRNGGWYVAPLLFGALIWMTLDRNRILAALQEKSKKLEDLTERTIVVMTELKSWLSGKGHK